MNPWLRRVFGASAIVAAGLLAVPAACTGPPRDEQVGQVGQPCFPGDLCDLGLTCIAKAIPSDAGSLGTDGGQCFDLRKGGASSAGDVVVDAVD